MVITNDYARKAVKTDKDGRVFLVNTACRVFLYTSNGGIPFTVVNYVPEGTNVDFQNPFISLMGEFEARNGDWRVHEMDPSAPLFDTPRFFWGNRI